MGIPLSFLQKKRHSCFELRDRLLVVNGIKLHLRKHTFYWTKMLLMRTKTIKWMRGVLLDANKKSFSICI